MNFIITRRISWFKRHYIFSVSLVVVQWYLISREQILEYMFQRIGKLILINDRSFIKTVICINIMINHIRDSRKMLIKGMAIIWFEVLLPLIFTYCIPWFLWFLSNSLCINFQEVLLLEFKVCLSYSSLFAFFITFHRIQQ